MSETDAPGPVSVSYYVVVRVIRGDVDSEIRHKVPSRMQAMAIVQDWLSEGVDVMRIERVATWQHTETTIV